MAAVKVQEAQGSGSGTTVTVTLATQPAAGNALIAWISDPLVAAINATGAGGGVTWGYVDNYGNINNLVLLAGFGASGSGGTTLTFTFDSAHAHVVTVSEWSGVGSVDAFLGTGASLATITSPTLTPAANSCLVMAAFDLNSASTYGAAGGGFTNMTGKALGNVQVQAAYLIGTGATARTATWTQSAASGDDVIIVSFLPPVSGTNAPEGVASGSGAAQNASTSSSSGASLQGPGSVGIRFYVSTASNTPVTSRWDELQGLDTAGSAPPPFVSAPAGIAAGTGASWPVTSPGNRFAPAGVAAGTGAAPQTIMTRAVAGVAHGTGVALPPLGGASAGASRAHVASRAVVVPAAGSPLGAPETYPWAQYDSLALTEQFWAGDSFVMTIGASATGADSLIEGALLWLPDEDDAVYLIERIQSDKTGASRANAELTVSGRSVDGFIGAERRVLPLPGQDYDSQASVAAETAMKHYVRAQAGVEAPAARAIPNLVVAPDLAQGTPVSINARFQALGDVLLQIGLLGPLGWQTTIDPVTGNIVWDVVVPADRSASVFFDFDFETITSWTDVEDSTSSSTVAIVAGQGDLSDRDVEIRYQGMEPTGFDRREAFVDARDVAPGDLGTLDARGDAFLAANAPTRSTDATIYPNGSFQPGRDFDLGDVVLLHDLVAGVNESARIVKIVKTFTTSAAAPAIVVSVGKPFPGVTAALAAPQGGALDTVITTIGDVNGAISTVVGGLSAGGANLVPDSSFENAVSGLWDVGANWTCPYTASGIFGGSSARVQLAEQVAGDLATSAFISVNPTDDYWLSFWSFLSAYTDGAARFSVREYDVTGVLLATTNLDLTAVELVATRHALHFGLDATTPNRIAWQPTTSRIKLAFLTAGPSTLTWEVDGVQAERGKIITAYAPAPQELVDGQVGATQIADGSITTEKVIANAITAGKIAAGAVTADKLAATLILGSLIKTADSGARIELDTTGLRAIDSTGTILVNVPTDGVRPVKVKGEIDALSLVVTGGAVLQGTANELAQGAAMILDSFQSNPSQAPTLAQSLDGVAFDPALWPELGLAYDSAGGAGGATKVFHVLQVIQGPAGGVLLCELLASTRGLNRSVLLPWQAFGSFPVGLFASVAVSANWIHVVSTQFDGATSDGRANTWVYRVNKATLALDSVRLVANKAAQQTITFSIGGNSPNGGFSITYQPTVALPGRLDQTAPVTTILFQKGVNLTAPAIQLALRSATADAGLTVTGPTNTGPFVVQFSRGTAEHDLVLNWNTGNQSSSVVSYALGGWSTPVIAVSGTTVYLVDLDNVNNGNPPLYWRSYDESMIFGAQVVSSYHPGWTAPLLGAVAGSFDVGAARVAVAFGGDPATFAVSGKVEHFDTSGVLQTNEEWRLRSTGATNGGIAYGDAAGDGARFWSWADVDLGTSVALAKHSTWTWTSASPIYWVGYSWYDSAGATHESQVGPRASITMLRRRQLTVSAGTLPGSGGADDPNNVRVYMAPNATDPGRTALELQATSASPTVLLTSYNAAGGADPGANGFSSTGVPATLGSGSAGWSLKGDGSLSRLGTAFPTTPAAGDRYVRSDLGYQEFVYDGTRWLSALRYLLQLPIATGTLPAAVTSDVLWRMAHPGIGMGLDVWMERLDIEWLVGTGTALSGSNEWVGSFTKLNASNVATGIATITIASGTLNVWNANAQTLAGGSVLAVATYPLLMLSWTKTGTPGVLHAFPTLAYRLIAT